MIGIIKYYFTGNFVELERYLNNNINIPEIEYYTLIYYLVYGKNDQDINIHKLLYLLFKYKLKINNEVHNIYDLIQIFIEKKYTLCSRFIITQLNLNEYANDLYNNSGLISRFTKNYITKLETLSQVLFKIIASFVDESFIHALQANIDNIYWIETNSIEMQDRLVQLINLFGVNLLKKVGVKIIKYDVFDKYTYLEKINYYIDSVECVVLYITKFKLIAKVENPIEY